MMQLAVHFRPIVSVSYLGANSNNPVELFFRVQTILLPGRRLSSHIFWCNATEITDFQFGESFCWAGEPVIPARTAIGRPTKAPPSGGTVPRPYEAQTFDRFGSVTPSSRPVLDSWPRRARQSERVGRGGSFVEDGEDVAVSPSGELACYWTVEIGRILPLYSFMIDYHWRIFSIFPE